MKKLVAIILTFAIVASMGVFTVIADGAEVISGGTPTVVTSNEPQSFYENGGYQYRVYLDTSLNGGYSSMGGGDGIYDKTTIKDSEDADLYYRGLVSIWKDPNDTSLGIDGYPELQMGFYVVDTQEYIWSSDATVFPAHELTASWTDVDMVSAKAWGATCFQLGFNSSVFPAGDHAVKLVCKNLTGAHAGEIFELGERTSANPQPDGYDGPTGCFVTYVKSSGTNYGKPAEHLTAVYDYAINYAMYDIGFTVTDVVGGYGEYGGQDLISDRTSSVVDETIEIDGWVKFSTALLQKFGYVIDRGTDAETYIWEYEEPRRTYFSGELPVAFDIDTSAFPAGDHVIELAAMVNNNIELVGIRSDNGHCFTITVTSSGANFVPTQLDVASVDLEGKKFTVNVPPMIAICDNIANYDLYFGDEKADVVDGAFVSPAIDLNEIDKEFDIELYNGDELVDSVEGFSVKSYLEAIDEPVAKDILALASALDVYNDGEGFTVEGARTITKADLPARTNSTKEILKATDSDKVDAASLRIDEDINVIFYMTATDATRAVISAPGYDDVEVTDLSKGYGADVSLADLDTVFTVEMFVGDATDPIASATYAPIDYIYNMIDSQVSNVGEICGALYAIYDDINA